MAYLLFTLQLDIESIHLTQNQSTQHQSILPDKVISELIFVQDSQSQAFAIQIR